MNNSKADEKAKKELEKFKKDFNKLMSKYPNVIVSSDTRGDLMAYHTVACTKICID